MFVLECNIERQIKYEYTFGFHLILLFKTKKCILSYKTNCSH